jgi:rhodanese-related sulfurtransferase
LNQHEEKLIVDARWLREHRDGNDLILIDTRPAKDFRTGHLRGARHFDPFPLRSLAHSFSGYFRRSESPAARPSCFTKMNPECVHRAASGRSNTRAIHGRECLTAGSRRRRAKS